MMHNCCIAIRDLGPPLFLLEACFCQKCRGWQGDSAAFCRATATLPPFFMLLQLCHLLLCRRDSDAFCCAVVTLLLFVVPQWLSAPFCPTRFIDKTTSQLYISNPSPVLCQSYRSFHLSNVQSHPISNTYAYASSRRHSWMVQQFFLCSFVSHAYASPRRISYWKRQESGFNWSANAIFPPLHHILWYF